MITKNYFILNRGFHVFTTKILDKNEVGLKMVFFHNKDVLTILTFQVDIFEELLTCIDT